MKTNPTKRVRSAGEIAGAGGRPGRDNRGGRGGYRGRSDGNFNSFGDAFSRIGK